MCTRGFAVSKESLHCPRPRVVVIGYGNSLRGDDALGPLAAELVARRVHAAEVEICVCQTLTPDLAERIALASLVIFLDACREGTPGEVLCQTLSAEELDHLGGHQTAPQDLLNLARHLYGRLPDARLVGTAGESYEFADCRLTPTVQATLEPIVDRVCELIRLHLASWENT